MVVVGRGKVVHPCVILIGLMPTSYSARHSHGHSGVSLHFPRFLTFLCFLPCWPRKHPTGEWHHLVVFTAIHTPWCIASGNFYVVVHALSPSNFASSRGKWSFVARLVWHLRTRVCRGRNLERRLVSIEPAHVSHRDTFRLRSLLCSLVNHFHPTVRLSTIHDLSTRRTLLRNLLITFSHRHRVLFLFF